MGRARFAELCRLFSERVHSDKVRAVERTLGYVLHRLPEDQGKLLRSSAIEDAVNIADRLSAEWLMEILPYLDDYAEYMEKGPGRRLVRRYWDIDPEVVVGQEAPLCLRSWSDVLIRSLDQGELVEAVRRGGRVAEVVLDLRLDVLANSETWNSEIAELAKGALPRIVDVEQQRAVVFALIEASRGDLADSVCEEFGPDRVFDAVLSVAGGRTEVARRYAERAFSLMEDRQRVIIGTLQRPDVKVDRNLVYLFSESVPPHVPKCMGGVEVDPWVAMWRNGEGEIGARKEDQIMCFLLVRAIVEPSSHAASLLAVSFDRILDRHSAAKLRYESRSKIVKHLVLSDWFEWTFESRLTRTVATIIFRKCLNAKELASVSERKGRVRRLTRAISDFEGGRAYLKQVGERS